MMWRTIAVALLLAHAATALQFTTTLGTIADPCQIDLLNRAETLTNVNCVQAGIPNVGPASSHLIILPSQNPAIGTNIVTTIVGRGFLALGGVNQGLNFRLGNPTNDPAQYCTAANVDLTSPVAVGRVDSDTQITINIPLGTWATQAIELEAFPRPICLQVSALPAVTAVFPNLVIPFVWTGFLSGASYDCNFNDRLCTSRDINSITGLSAVRRAELATRNTCCRNVSPRAIFVETTPTGFAGTAFNLTVGSCINPNVQSCCGAVPITQQTEKCCNVALQTTAFVDGFCPCRVSSDCAAPQTTLAGLENSCCRNQRPINIVGEAVDTQFFGGQCFNPANTRCCATGEAYDPGAQQCCPVNGLQSLNLPCPCNVDTDCAGIADNNARCCRQTTPTLLQQANAVCNAFTNYAQGVSIPPQATRCLGTCYDSRFGVCCNGATCLREIENCCNNTCCNRFTQGCFRARGSGVPGFAGNNADFNVIYARCSAIEYLDSVRVFWFAVLPALLLLASFLALALALVFVNKASARRTSFLELALIVVAVITFIFALPLYFAPVYKYGIVTAFACIVAILAAGVRVRWLNGFAIVLLAIAVIYVIDPFFGNAWLTLTSDRVHFGGTNNNGGFANPFIVGTADVRTSGVLHASNFLFKDREATVSPLLRRCVRFYNYFSIDPNLVDYSRIDNPEIQTFGYCSRAWIIGQIYIEGLLILFLLVTFILAVLALIVRFRKLRFEPIELEVRDVAPGVVY